jgi:hypothetical protein
MKAMATFDTVIVCIRRGCPAGWAKKVKPLATSSTECRVWPILELALGTDHANNSFLLLLPGADSIISRNFLYQPLWIFKILLAGYSGLGLASSVHLLVEAINSQACAINE